MIDEYTAKMVELTSKRKKIIDDGEALLKSKRIELGVEEYFDIDILLNPSARIAAIDIVKKYIDHLNVEKAFYSEYHRTFIEESIEISNLLLSEERERLLPRTIEGLEENSAIRIRINEIKILTATKIQRVIEIFDSNEVMG
ncbi:hypothetical protein GQR58_023155 [Nymphon striatum]|nr:hypothetical protein GQR58_023155 [Nymphon striatum]